MHYPQNALQLPPPPPHPNVLAGLVEGNHSQLYDLTYDHDLVTTISFNTLWDRHSVRKKHSSMHPPTHTHLYRQCISITMHLSNTWSWLKLFVSFYMYIHHFCLLFFRVLWIYMPLVVFIICQCPWTRKPTIVSRSWFVWFLRFLVTVIVIGATKKKREKRGKSLRGVPKMTSWYEIQIFEAYCT